MKTAVESKGINPPGLGPMESGFEGVGADMRKGTNEEPAGKNEA
jgi:hypothetical protein